MRYMMMIYSQETTEPLSPEENEAISQGHRAVMADAGAQGVLVGWEKLKPTNTATSVRTAGGKAITTDGPFAETKEQFAGYYIMECKNLDEAIEWAARIPTSCRGQSGCIEIRPIEVGNPKS